jgi:hypothetical protein
MAKSYANYVTTSGDNGKYSTNGLRFATEKEAEAYGRDLLSRWFAVVASEVRPTDDEPNYCWDFTTGKLVPLIRED